MDDPVVYLFKSSLETKFQCQVQTFLIIFVVPRFLWIRLFYFALFLPSYMYNIIRYVCNAFENFKTILTRFRLPDCPDGHYGTGCIHPCPPTKYGRFCANSCNCSAGQCNAITGCNMGKCVLLSLEELGLCISKAG